MKLFAKGEWFEKLSVCEKGNSGNYSMLGVYLGSGKQLCKNVSLWLSGSVFYAWQQPEPIAQFASCMQVVCAPRLIYWCWGFDCLVLTANSACSRCYPSLAISGSPALHTFHCKSLPASHLHVSAMPLVPAEFLLGVFLESWGSAAQT